VTFDLIEFHAHARIEAHRLKGPFIVAHRNLVVRASEVMVGCRRRHAPCQDVAKVAYGMASLDRFCPNFRRSRVTSAKARQTSSAFYRAHPCEVEMRSLDSCS
jgi:hypothetical protein